ncbi:MAG TPA: hypothetical protein PKV67_01125 [Hyphomonas sp.]|nr:hypothetical protein [Hyphomonas sp.]
MKMDLGYTRLIVEECRKAGLLRNQCAYVLATAYHETAHTMKPVREMGGEKYLKSKPYYPYVGMGFVQLTWKRNYEKAGKALGVDFVANPKKLLEPAYSAAILVTGMKEGWFTGKSLEDYITLYKSDYTGARRIVNGTDRAKLIAGHAVEYDAALKAMGYGEEKPVDPAKPAPAPSPAPVPQSPPAPKPAPKRGILAIIFEIIGKILKGGR